MNDEELHRLLLQHPTKISLPITYTREVWSRIELHEQRSMKSLLADLLSRIFTSLARPVVAFATITLFGVLGAGAGLAMIEQPNSTPGEHAYLETVNPLVRTHSEEKP